MSASSSERPFPAALGRYELLAPIASGGMATVYLARATGAGGFARQVAIKLLDPRTGDQHTGPAQDSLLAEARLAARIRHPAVVPVLDAGESGQGDYLVMEFVEGDSLANLQHAAQKAGERLPAPIALRILSDALEGLHAAHQAQDETGKPLGIVHRDFSPQNILVGVDGQSRLTDFGIARSVDRAEYTRTGVVRGKIGYMSPEQAEGAILDRTCDVWAAGVVAWEALAGRRLFTGDPVPTLLRILNTTPPSLCSVAPEVPVAVSEVIASALVKDPGSRCDSAGELRRRLLAAAHGWAEPAPTEEVAEYVRSVAAPKLQALRERSAQPRSPLAERTVAVARRRPGWWMAGVSLLAVGALIPFMRRQAPDASPVSTAHLASAPLKADVTVEAAPFPSVVAAQSVQTSGEASRPAPEAPPKARANRLRSSSGISPAPKTAPRAERAPSDLAPNPY